MNLRVGILSLVLAPAAFAAGPLTVVTVEPTARTTTASVHTPIVIHFDRPVLRASVTSTTLWAFGRWSGSVSGALTFSNSDRTVTLNPLAPLSAGEQVMVFVSHDVKGADAIPLRPGGYSFQFWTRAGVAPLLFAEIDAMTTRTTPSAPTRAYGGVASDLDGDRQLDVTIVNETTADLRVFRNRADGSGLFFPFIQPTTPVGTNASPSEPADFDRDGHVDLGVANTGGNSVSIVRGKGDGTFFPQQLVSVGMVPRGIAVLDADGDGDVDVANTNFSSNNMSLLLNNGSGVFGPASFFPSGATSPWALAAADMNEDGILDLVVGSRDTQQIMVLAGNGNGGFSPVSLSPAGGRVWTLVTGDLNGDGHDDVAASDSYSSSGSILLGNGAGSLAAPVVYAPGEFGLASDIGDLDGDGDLDWVTSNYEGSWRVNLNNGSGAFTLFDEFVPAQSASCALLADLDNDADVDLALIDEFADEIVIMRNSGVALPAPPPGVPAGGGGNSPLRVAKTDPAGLNLVVSWDVGCAGAADNQLLYGYRSQLPAALGGTYALTGARCGVGTSSPFHWLASPDPAADPSRLLWFLLVSRDPGTIEGSWGHNSAGNERSGPGAGGASGACGVTAKSLTNTCGQTRP